MTRFTLELAAVDDRAAIAMFENLVASMRGSTKGNRKLAPGYSISDIDGSVVCNVTREDNGIERGMEVTP